VCQLPASPPHFATLLVYIRTVGSDDGVSVDASTDLARVARTRHVAAVARAVFAVRVSTRTQRHRLRVVADRLQPGVLVVLHAHAAAKKI